MVRSYLRDMVLILSVFLSPLAWAADQSSISESSKGGRLLQKSAELKKQLSDIRILVKQVEKSCKAIPRFSVNISDEISYCDSKDCVSEGLKQYEAEAQRLLTACAGQAKWPRDRVRRAGFTKLLRDYDLYVEPLELCTVEGEPSPDGKTPCGAARLSIHRKGRAEPMQSWVFGDHGIPNDAQSQFNVDDFNFDGREDFAVMEDYSGPYGGLTYAVFLAGPKGFTLHQDLSDLTRSGLGFFTVDAKTKTLHTFSKSGCCDHWDTTYGMRGEKLFPLSEERELLRKDGMGEVTRSRFVNGKWRVESRKVFRPQSYCEDFIYTLASSELHYGEFPRYIYPSSCALMPGHPNWVIFTTLHPKRDVIEDIYRDGCCKALDVMVADKNSESALVTYWGEEQFLDGKLSTEDVFIDTAPYVLKKGQRAFGIRNYFGTTDGKIRFQRLNLFLSDGQTLNNIVRNLLVRVRGENFVVERVLFMDKRPKSDVADIVVSETRIEFSQPDERGQEKELSRSRKKYRLEYDGASYVIPSELTTVR